jgi:nitric oxide reductase subunit B
MAKISFWSLNLGLAWMVFATLLPLGVIQLWHSVNDGYYEARTLGFITQPGNALLEWLRMPGDLTMIVGGVLPFLWITWLGVRHRIRSTTHVVPQEELFVEARPVGTGGGAARGPATVDEPETRDRSRYASDRRPPDDERPDGGTGT